MLSTILVRLYLGNESVFTYKCLFSGITPLHIAVMNDDKSCIDILLRYGADPKTLVNTLQYNFICDLIFLQNTMLFAERFE